MHISKFKATFLKNKVSISKFQDIFLRLMSILGNKNFAIHGIQRSGTNFLCEYFKKVDLMPINYPDKARNNPRHKHFRWYSKKELIPSVIKSQYGNDIYAENIYEINEICKYPKYTQHFVMIKDKKSWILSILNWGMRCNWFSSKSNALKFVKKFIEDYDAYYSFWRKMRSSDPQMIHFFDTESIMNDPISFNKFLVKIFKLKKQPEFDGIFDSVPMSPKNRTIIFNQSDLKFIYSLYD